MNAGSSWLGVLLGTAFLMFACQEPEPHPPLVEPCDSGKRCSLGLGQVGSPPTSTGGNGAGGGSTGGNAGAGGGVLHGTVVDLVDDNFVTSLPFADLATIEAQSTTGAVISASWNGRDPFLLSGVESSPLTWISVRPSSGTANLRTLHPVATNIERTVDLGLARADVIDGILGILSVPAQRTPGSAQIVLVFTVTSGASMVGATGVSVKLADSQLAAYESNGVWSSDAVGTGISGLAILGNVPAAVFPGVSKHVVLGGSSSGSIDIRVAADAVSLVSVPLSP
jgi:hypothetical protein